jgi:hypothetical protein
MNRKTLKIVMLLINLIVSVLCIFLFIYEKIHNNTFMSFNFKYVDIYFYLVYFNIFFCIIGIILFIRYLIYTDDKTFSDKYILLIPSIIVLLLLLFIGGFAISGLLFII